MEMPDKIYLFPDANSIGDLGFTITYPKESWDGREYVEYYHSRVVEDLKQNLAETVIALAARNSEIIVLKAKLDKAKDALKFYADHDTYASTIITFDEGHQSDYGDSLFDEDDFGDKARQTLKELE